MNHLLFLLLLFLFFLLFLLYTLFFKLLLLYFISKKLLYLKKNNVGSKIINNNPNLSKYFIKYNKYNKALLISCFLFVL